MAGQSYLRSSRLISALTLLSRLTGLVRDVVLTAWLGDSWIHDRFRYAFTIPHLFRRLFGEGALSAAFIPVLSDRLSRDGNDRAGKLFGNVATLLAAMLTVLTLALLTILALVWFWSDRDANRRLTLALTALMCPYMIFVCLVALFSAFLNCFDRFGLPAFMPIILNLFQIAAVVVAKYVVAIWTDRLDIQVYALGVAVLLAGVVQLFLMIRSAHRLGIRWGISFSVRDADLRRILVMLGPMALGLGVLQIGTFLDNQIILSLSAKTGETFEFLGRRLGYPLETGSLVGVDLARRLYNLPLGVLAISLATAAFPTFSRYAASGNHVALRESVSHGLRMAIFEGLPCGIGMIVITELIVRVIFERGHFGPQATAQTSHVLRMYCLGLWAYCAQHIILRAFYSLKDTKTPLRVMMVTLALSVVLNLVLIWFPSIRAGAFGLSTAAMCSINAIALCVIFSRRFGSLSLRSIVRSAARVLTASLVMATAVYLCQQHVAGANKYLQLAACLGVGIVVFAAACRLLKISEFGELLGLSKHEN